MSTTISIPRPASRRNQIVASATAVVAAAAVAVTLAVAGGSDGTQPAASHQSATPATAQPNPATQYRNESVVPSGPARQAGTGAADRFHHFR
jgi:hypothetical protein